MKNRLVTFIILTFYSFQAMATEFQVTNYSVNTIQTELDSEPDSLDEFCDTTLITDFKSNLTILHEKLTDAEQEYQLKHATDFIQKSCEIDSLFCGEINFKKSTNYGFNSEWKLLLTGYVLDQGEGMEEESASFFVLTLVRNNEFWFTDILEDLMGEIQVELNGFEEKETQLIVWGHAYPFFQSEFGKFRLMINDGMMEYEFQCHSEE